MQEEDILTEESEVERPQALGDIASEIGSERRYATRQATRKQQSQPSNVEAEKVSSGSCLVTPLQMCLSTHAWMQAQLGFTLNWTVHAGITVQVLLGLQLKFSLHALQAERRMLLDQQLYPPNIAETLAALQRLPESSMQPSGSSRYTLQV